MFYSFTTYLSYAKPRELFVLKWTDVSGLVLRASGVLTKRASTKCHTDPDFPALPIQHLASKHLSLPQQRKKEEETNVLTMSAPVPIKNSIMQVSPSLWRLGTTMECERVEEPNNLGVAAWKDGDSWYTLRIASSEQPSEIAATSSSEFCLVHEGGTLSAVWAIGNNAFCKVKYWDSSTTSESETIEFVRRNVPQVPTPEVIYSWVDRGRSFLLLRRVRGATLRDTWETLSPAEQDSILCEVVHLCGALASITSTQLQNVQGGPVLEPYLAHSKKDSLEPLTVSECKQYFFRADLHPNPEIEEQFHLYHPDLGPGNIIISNKKISAIIDWEATGFYPRFWIATKPSVSPGLDFHPPIPGVDDVEWRRRLRMKLEEYHYPRFAEWYMEWRKTKSRERNQGCFCDDLGNEVLQLYGNGPSQRQSGCFEERSGSD